MYRYVLGFLFSDNAEYVALIRKNRPAWAEGKLNGLGGKIEPGETRREAMEREAYEEAGVFPKWAYYGKVVINVDENSRNRGEIYLYKSFSDYNLAEVSTRETEHVDVYNVNQVIQQKTTDLCLPLMFMALSGNSYEVTRL